MKFSIKDNKFIDNLNAPEMLSVAGQDEDLSWKELQLRTHFYVTKIRESGIIQGDAIGILGHKQADYIAAICACIILKCPYVPMNDRYSSQWTDEIIKSAKVDFVIEIESKSIIKLTKNQDIKKDLSENNNLIYIIFTSGTTGLPKGIKITKENILFLLNWMKNELNLPEQTVFMNQASFCFDLSVFEVMYTLNYGKSIILNSTEQIKNNPLFISRLKSYKVNTWVSTPSFLFQQSMFENLNANLLPELNYFLLCGEQLKNSLVQKIKSHFPNCRIINSYGPTEATVASTWIEITNQILNHYNPLPIGNAPEGTNVFINEDNEICIIGPNIMEGYTNSKDSNKSNIFTHNGIRGFKTGDLGFSKDNLLFFNGRIDDQIKMHGHRIELAKIDQLLLKINGILGAISLGLVQDGEVKRIISFIILKNFSLSDQEIKNDLLKNIPPYMVPSEFIRVDFFPTNNNYKIDRNKLIKNYHDLKKESLNETINDDVNTIKKLIKKVTLKNVSHNDSLISSGILDSMTSVELSVQLEKKFEIQISSIEINKNNFENVSKIFELVLRKKQK